MLAGMHVLWDVEVWKCGRVVTDAADDLFVSIFRVYTVFSWTSQGATTRDFCVAIVRDCTEDRDRHFEDAPNNFLRNSGNYSSFDTPFHISDDLNSRFFSCTNHFSWHILTKCPRFLSTGLSYGEFSVQFRQVNLLSESFPSFMNTHHGNKSGLNPFQYKQFSPKWKSFLFLRCQIHRY
jgi:hypothetical protein